MYTLCESGWKCIISWVQRRAQKLHNSLFLFIPLAEDDLFSDFGSGQDELVQWLWLKGMLVR